MLGRPRVAWVGLADGISRAELVSVKVVVVLNSNCSPVKRLSGPLAVAVEPVSVAVSKAQTLNRPVSGRDSVSRVDSNSSVEGLSGPLAVAGVELSPLLERAGSTGMRLADGISRGQLMSVNVVAVLKSGGEGNSVADSVSNGSISGPLAIAGVELSPLLVRAAEAGVRLADGVTGSKLVSVNVVTVLKSGGESDSISNSVSDGRISTPLADTVSVGSVDSGSSEEARGRPGGEAGAAVVVG